MDKAIIKLEQKQTSGAKKEMNKFIDHLIAIFPFEKVYFDKYNLPCSYFGNPLVNLIFLMLI